MVNHCFWGSPGSPFSDKAKATVKSSPSLVQGLGTTDLTSPGCGKPPIPCCTMANLRSLARFNHVWVWTHPGFWHILAIYQHVLTKKSAVHLEIWTSWALLVNHSKTPHRNRGTVGLVELLAGIVLAIGHQAQLGIHAIDCHHGVGHFGDLEVSTERRLLVSNIHHKIRVASLRISVFESWFLVQSTCGFASKFKWHLISCGSIPALLSVFLEAQCSSVFNDDIKDCVHHFLLDSNPPKVWKVLSNHHHPTISIQYTYLYCFQ
jgi:hypothetical protein